MTFKALVLGTAFAIAIAALAVLGAASGRAIALCEASQSFDTCFQAINR